MVVVVVVVDVPFVVVVLVVPIFLLSLKRCSSASQLDVKVPFLSTLLIKVNGSISIKFPSS
jgi:hypothetical protein